MHDEHMSPMRTPASWLPATWRATLPPEAGGDQAISFDLPAGQVIRLRLDAASVRHVVETLAPGYFCDSRCQSGRSELSPSAPMSVPSDGVKTAPAAASSTADAADA